MNNSMIVTGEDGKDIKIDIVGRWNTKGIDYIAYNDGTKDGEKLNVYTSRCVQDGDFLKLEPIESNEEWIEVFNVLNERLFEDDPFDNFESFGDVV